MIKLRVAKPGRSRQSLIHQEVAAVALVDDKNLVGGFEDVLFSPLFGEDSQFD